MDESKNIDNHNSIKHSIRDYVLNSPELGKERRRLLPDKIRRISDYLVSDGVQDGYIRNITGDFQEPYKEIKK